MKKIKYFIPIIGALLKNNPYQSRFKKPSLKEIIYDFYHILVSVSFIIFLILMTF